MPPTCHECRQVIEHEVRLDAQNERLREHIEQTDAQITDIYDKINWYVRVMTFGLLAVVALVVCVSLFGVERSSKLLELIIQNL